MRENEYHNNTSESLGIDTLEHVFSDPFVTRVLNMAKVYNQILEDDLSSHEEIDFIVEDLDSEWGILRGRQAKYTGYVKAARLDSEEDTDQEALFVTFLDEADIISNGFVVNTQERATGDGEVKSVARVQHHMYALPQDVYGNENREHYNESLLVAITGDVEDGFIRFDGASPEHARAWLSHSCPELMSEIDVLLLNGDGQESTALLALKELNFNSLADMSDEFTRMCVDIYLNQILEMDKTVPYSLSIDGPGRTNDEVSRGVLATISAERVLAYAPEVALQPAFRKEYSPEWELGVHLGVLTNSRTQQPRRFIVRIDAIQAMTSLRSEYYES